MTDIAALPPSWIVALTGILTFLSIYGGLFAFVGSSGRVQAGKRIGYVDVKTGAAKGKSAERRKSIQQQIKEQEERRQNRKQSVTMADRLLSAGMNVSLTKFYMIFAGIGFMLVMLLITMGMSPLFATLALPVALYFLPRWWVNRIIKKKEKKFIEELPNAIDVLVRGVRTGLPVNDGLRLISRELPPPISVEFAKMVDEVSVGVALDDALRRLYHRMPLPEVNFFNIVLIIQKQTGGNLAEALGNLSAIIRDRKKLRNKIKALSSEAKASAMIIGSLPFVLGLILLAVAPEYIKLLFTETMGHYLLAAGGTWMGLGIFVMKQMINIDI